MPDLFTITEQATQALLKRQMLVCTAESCTGGYLAQMLTALPGSSFWFDCGFVTYSNTAKQQLLQVPERMIAEYGAVSEAVAIAMAQGALANSSANISIAITGIAGPAGGTNDKPVGTVWLAWQLHNREAITRCMHFSGDRDSIRKQTVVFALQMLLDMG